MTRLFHLDATSAKIVEITDWSELGIDDEACKNSKNSKSKQCRQYTVTQKRNKKYHKLCQM